ncbi:MAG: ADP-ribosylglycohydrolase family protein [Desulfobacteraceae bacterium]|nr:ADP-ribosylglycohydrolase family protein [Desulfobacteraceae bacterium]
MIGAIAGDIIGSVYEHHPVKTKTFPLFDDRCRFTDDTVLTVAIADAILSGTSYTDSVRTVGQRHPHAGYGGSFIQWLFADNPKPYNSWGNGAAMRVSPVGFAFTTEEEVLDQARMTAQITHNHPEGIKGAQATALAVFLARTGCDKKTIKERTIQLPRHFMEIFPLISGPESKPPCPRICGKWYRHFVTNTDLPIEKLLFSGIIQQKTNFYDLGERDPFRYLCTILEISVRYGIPGKLQLKSVLANISRQFLEAPMLEKFWNEHQCGLRNRSTELWIIMMLNLWQKNFG